MSQNDDRHESGPYRCSACNQLFSSDHNCPEAPMSGDRNETLWTHDPETDRYFRIETWAYSGAGDVVPKEYTEVTKDRVPPHHRANTLGLKAMEVSDRGE